jgi:hypothetical protein
LRYNLLTIRDETVDHGGWRPTGVVVRVSPFRQ